MKRARLGLIAAPLIASIGLFGPGCEDRGAVMAPNVTVLRWDAIKECYSVCQGGDALDLAVAADLGSPVCQGNAGAPEEVACSLRGGEDKLLILGDYAGLSVNACESVGVPELSVILDDQGEKAIGGLVYGCFPDDTGGNHYYVHRVLTAPVARSIGMVLRVSAGESFTKDTTTYPLSLPVVGLSVCADQPDDCHKVAGVDSTEVTVTVPAGVAATSALVRYGTGTGGAGAAGEITVPFNRVEGDFKSGSQAISMPDAPSAALTVTAYVDGLDPVSDQITLTAPLDLVVKTEKPSAPKIAYARVVAGDPDAVCRQLNVRVEAPSGAPENQVTIQASAGTLDGVEGQVVRAVSKDKPALALLEIPFGETSQAVLINARAGEALSTSINVDLLRMLPQAASLAASQKAIVVGANGAPAVLLKGTVSSPKSGALFAADTPLLVTIDATAASPMPSLPCGALTDAGDIDCSPLDPTMLPGGCLLAQKTVLVSPTGEFTIALAGGACFAGTIQVDVWSTRYTSSEVCLRDRLVSGAPERLTVGPPLTLTYGP